MTDLDGGSLLRGDTVVVDISVTNSGSGVATHVSLRDTITAALTYVPGTLSITSGPNTGPKTDIASDDEASFIAGTRQVRFQLGTGATPSTGGSLAPGMSTSVRFRAVVVATATSGQIIPNSARVTYRNPLTGNDLAAESRPPGGPREGAPTTIVVRLPDLTVAKSHSGSFVRGQSGTYTLSVSNIGQGATAGPVTVTDVVPVGLTPLSAVGTGWSCSIAAQIVSCSRTTPILAGATAPAITLTVNVLASAPGSVVNTVTVATASESDTGNNSASDSTTIVDPPADLTISKSHGGNFVAGQNGTFTITVTNLTTPAVAGPVTVTDTLPAGLTFLGGVGTGWICSAAGPVVTCSNPGPLAGNTSTSFALNVAVGAAAFPSVTNRAHVAVPGGDANPGNNTATDVVMVVSVPDLAIVKTATSPFAVGSNATYSLTISNVSSGPTAGATVVTDTLPLGLTYVSGPPFCAVSGQVVTCTATGVLAPGATVTLPITVAVGAAAAPSVTNRAHVATPNDVNFSNNSSQVTTPVTGPTAPDLTIAKTSSPAFTVGAAGLYSLVVSNVGTGVTTGAITVTDTLPTGISFTSAAGSGWSCAASGAVVTCSSNGPVGPGASLPPLDLNVAVSATAIPSVVNRAHVGTAADANPGNNTASVTTPVNPLPVIDLTISKTHSGTFVVGLNGTYQIAVSNVGNTATAGPITVTDTLAAGLTFSGFSGAGWSCSAAGQVVTCTSAGPVNGGAALPTLNLTVAVGPVALGTIDSFAHVITPGDSNPTNNRDNDPTTVISIPDLAILKSATSAFTVGANATYNLQVTNVSPGPTTGPLALTDTLPNGLTFVSGTGSGWTCGATGQVVGCTHPGPLAAGGITNATLTVAVGPAAAPQVVNRAHVSTPGDVNTSNNSSSVTTPVVLPPDIDLSLAKSHVGNFTALQAGTYTLVVTNVGTAPTNGAITIIDTLPNGLTYQSGIGSGWTCGAAGQIVTCANPGPLAPSASSTVTLTVHVGAAAFPKVTNRAHVATRGDSNAGNNTAIDPTTVESAPDLSISKAATGPFTVGANAGYALVVTNVSAVAATGPITVTDNLPNGLTLVSAGGVAWTCGATAQLVTCTNPGPLAAGASSIITLNVVVGAAAAPSVTNTANVSTIGDVNTGNNSATITTPVGSPALDLAIVKTSSALAVGSQGTFTLTVSNVSTVATTGPITVSDNLQAGLTFVSGSGPAFTCTASGQAVTCVRSTPLVPGQSAAVTLVVAVGSAAFPSVVNTGTVSTPGDTFLPNNTSTIGPIPVTPAAPDLALKKRLIGTPVAGQDATFLIEVTNVGSGPTTGPITVTDVLIPGLTFVSGTGTGWSCGATGQTVTCTNPGPLAPGASTSLFLTVSVAANLTVISNTATVKTPGDPGPGNDTDTVNPTPITQVPDLAISKTANGVFRVGQPATYTLTVSNVGLGPTTGPITVVDNLPAGLTFVSATGPGWSCAASAQTVTCTHPGPLAPNASLSVSLTVLPTAAAVPSVVNTATVSTPGDPNPGNDGTSTTTPVGGTIDLVLNKQGPDTVTAGAAATYRLSVRNLGTVPTSGPITITDSLPAGLTYLNGTGGGFTCSAAGQLVTCTRTQPLQPGASASVDIDVTVGAGVGATVRNAACVTTPQDTNAANNCGEKQSTTTGAVDLVASKSASTALEVGQPATFTVTVRNVGTIAARPPLTVVDTLPPGLTFASATGAGWTCSAAGSVVTCTRSIALGPNETSVVNLEVSVGAAAVPVVTNCATVRGTNETGSLANNQSCVTVPVAPPGRLELQKTASKRSAELGDMIDYSLLVKNVGGVLLNDVHVTDVLPVGFLLEPNTTRVGGAPVAVSGAPGPNLTIPVGVIAAGGSVVITYRVRVGPGARVGVATNVAVATGRGVTSPAARARVRITTGVLDERGAIVGKVYLQCACNDRSDQDAGEVGIPGVRVYLEDGTSAVTDVEGKYNFINVSSRLHVVKVDRTTLPAGAVLVPLVSRNAGDGYSRFVDLKAGELHRADFADGSKSNAVLRAVLGRRRAGEVNNAGDPAFGVAGYDSVGRVGATRTQLVVGDSLVAVPSPTVFAQRGRAQPSTEAYTPIAAYRLSELNSQLPITPLRARAVQEGRHPSNGGRLSVSIGDGKALPADGVTMALVTVRLTNSRGQPRPGSTTATLEASLGRWLGRDLGATEQGVQVVLENGEGQFTLVAAPVPGRGEVRVTTDDASATVPVAFVPVARELLMTGLLNARVDFRTLVRGGLGVSRGDDGFEESLRDWSSDRDSGKTVGGARAAILVKGAVFDNRLLTLSFDTERERDRTLFRDIRPEDFFPVFGDASMREFDAQSNRRFYARLDKGTSYTLFGDFQTTRADDRRMLSAYDRGLTGVVQHAEGGRGAATVFASRGRQSQIVREIPGAGISGPYELDVNGTGLRNSERVEIIVRDRNQPSVILSRKPMTRFADYTTEPGSGRLIFRHPVPSMDPNFNPVSIRVSYEEERGGDAQWVYGGDAALRVTSVLEVGASFAKDEAPTGDFTLLGATATARLGRSTTFLGELARTDQALGADGSARRIEIRHQSPRLDARAFAMSSDAGFANSSSTFQGGRTEWGGRFSTPVAEGVRLAADLVHTEDTVNGFTRDGALVSLEKQLSASVRGELGYRYAKESGSQRTNPLLSSFQQRDRDVSAIRGRLQWTLPAETRTSFVAEFEQDVRDRDSRRALIGGEYLIANRARLFARHEILTAFEGPYAINQLGSGTPKAQHNTVFGIDADYLANTQIFSEYRSRDAFGGRDAEAAIGLRNRWAIAPGLIVNTTFSRVSPIAVRDPHGAPIAGGDGLSAAAALEWTKPALWKTTARVEVRDTEKRGDNFLASFGYARKLSRDWTLLGRSLWDVLDTDADRTRGFSQLGVAWRQTDQNKWNALARYENRYERLGATATGVAVVDRAHILATVVNYQPVSRVTLSGRYAAKASTARSGGLATDNTSQLLMGRGVLDLSSRADVGVIASSLFNDGFADRRYGLGAELGLIVMKNLRVAAGYNLFGFRDKDLDSFGTTRKGPYLELGFKFDETLFGLVSKAANAVRNGGKP